jgi:hypothetical protein
MKSTFRSEIQSKYHPRKDVGLTPLKLWVHRRDSHEANADPGPTSLVFHEKVTGVRKGITTDLLI